jgi:hypothetical protein
VDSNTVTTTRFLLLIYRSYTGHGLRVEITEITFLTLVHALLDLQHSVHAVGCATLNAAHPKTHSCLKVHPKTHSCLKVFHNSHSDSFRQIQPHGSWHVLYGSLRDRRKDTSDLATLGDVFPFQSLPQRFCSVVPARRDALRLAFWLRHTFRTIPPMIRTFKLFEARQFRPYALRVFTGVHPGAYQCVLSNSVNRSTLCNVPF